MSETGLAVVVDALEFRRACVASLLREWAATEAIALLPLSPEQALSGLWNATQCRLAVLNLGSAASSQPDVLTEIKVLRATVPAAALVVVADRDDPGDVFAAMQIGADAYVSNGLAPDLVFRALSFVLNGGTYFPRSIVEIKAPSSAPEPDPVPARNEEVKAPAAVPIAAEPPVAEAPECEDAAWSTKLLELSARQMAILAGLCRGEPNKVIGRTLNLPESTVKVHVREIMRKLAVSNRTQAALSIARLSRPVAAAADLTSSRVTDPSAGTTPACDANAIPLAPAAHSDDDAGKTGK